MESQLFTVKLAERTVYEIHQEGNLFVVFDYDTREIFSGKEALTKARMILSDFDVENQNGRL